MAIKFLNTVAVDTDVLYVDAASNEVGIGTTSPDSKLEVVEVRSGTGASAQTKYTLVSKSTVSSGTPGTGGIKVQYTDSSNNEHGFGLVAGSTSADFLTSGPMNWHTNSDLNTQSATGFAMTIDTSQRVGIGLTNPGARLHVKETTGSTSAGYVLRVESVNGGGDYFNTSGFYKDSSQNMRLILKSNVSGSSGEKVLLNSNGDSYLNGGNVGIGATSPDDGNLQIGDSNTSFNMAFAGPRTKFGYDGSSNAVVQGGASKGIKFCVNNSTFGSGEAMRVNTSGNVGIAVTDFTTTYGSVPDLRVGSISGTGAPGVIDILRKDGTVTAGETTGILQFSVDDDNNYCNAQIEVESASTVGSGNSGGGILKFKTTPSSSGGTPTEQMRIDSNGNVGIGVSNPSSFFNQASNLVIGGAGNIGATIYSSNSGNSFLAFADVADGANSGFNAGGSIYYEHANNAMVARVNGAERLRINSSGNVGIGHTDPASKLHIKQNTTGTGNSTGLIIEQDGTGDAIAQFLLTGARRWVLGADNSDSDKFKLASTSDLNTDAALTVDTSGNVGIGTTAPAEKLEVSGGAIKVTNTGAAQLILRGDSGDSGDSGNVDGIIDFIHDQGSYGYRLNTENYSGKNAFHIQDYQNSSYLSRIYIDQDGEVGIGTNSPAEKLVVSGTDDVSIRINSTSNKNWTADELLGAYEFYGNDASGAGAQIKAKIDCSAVNEYGAAFNMRFFTAGGGAGTSAAERMRIRYDGIVLIGKTSSGTNTAGLEFNPVGLATITRSGNVPLLVNRTTNDGTLVSFRRSNSQKGSISISGSTTAYNTTSDYRLKENVVDMAGSLDRIEQLQPKRFNFISEETTVDGFVAHEVQNIIPEAVLGEKDGVNENGEPEYQEIDNSKIVPLLVGAIKELKTEIENLKLQINS